MSRRSIDLLVAYVYAGVCFAVVLAPAIAVRWTSANLDIEPAGLDLVIASAVIGGGHAVIAWLRLRCEERTAVRRLDMWIAALNALEETDLLDPARLERAVGEADRFYVFLTELFDQIGQRDELRGVPFDRRRAAEALKLYLGD